MRRATTPPFPSLLISGFTGYNKAVTPVKKSDALSLLKILWEDIVKLDKTYVDRILRGLPDSIDSRSGRIVQTIQLKQLISNHLDELIEQAKKIRDEGGQTARKLKEVVSEHVVNMHVETQSLIKQENNTTDEDLALELQKLISQYIVNLHDGTEMIFSGEVGNTNFLLELIRQSPDLIWDVNDNNQTIFHVAVKHRHEDIYNLLYEIGAMKDMVTPLEDNDGNNMLHLAALRTRKKNIEDVSGAALQMQRELLWFKGEKWMKSTVSQGMVVATLIATIVFAAAFTVPGGYNQNDGIPIFKRKLSFVVADAISLFLSSASILTFLSIHTSRYAERDFVASSPMKLMFGLAALFLSIGTMMVTFSVSFFVLYNREMKWIPIFIGLYQNRN
ncbi:ankyrin repeat-containing domain, PGG domain protein [Tanacetum coccineum]